MVDEVQERFDAASAALLTEYRGLDVAAISELRRSLREAGGDYKVYKNTLVRFAAQNAGLDIEELLTGPTAIAFVGERPREFFRGAIRASANRRPAPVPGTASQRGVIRAAVVFSGGRWRPRPELNRRPTA